MTRVQQLTKHILTYFKNATLTSLYTQRRRQTKTLMLSTNIDQKSFQSPFVAGLVTNGNQKHCFYRFLIRVPQLLRAFSTAAYPVCFSSFNQQLNVNFLCFDDVKLGSAANTLGLIVQL